MYAITSVSKGFTIFFQVYGGHTLNKYMYKRFIVFSANLVHRTQTCSEIFEQIAETLGVVFRLFKDRRQFSSFQPSEGVHKVSMHSARYGSYVHSGVERKVTLEYWGQKSVKSFVPLLMIIY